MLFVEILFCKELSMFLVCFQSCKSCLSSNKQQDSFLFDRDFGSAILEGTLM